MGTSLSKTQLLTELRNEQACIGYLDHPFKNRHFEKRLIKEKRGANVELAREGLLDEGCCVGARGRS
ncbi:MAG TPA: hypothetical protein VF844_15640, partial [Ktedonobacteraceae bacterium]